MKLRRSVIAVLSVASVIWAQSALACSCLAAATIGATTTSGIVGAGSAAVALTITNSAGGAAQAITGSIQSQTKAIVNALDAVYIKLATEMRKLPAVTHTYESTMKLQGAGAQVTNACEYNTRSTALAAADGVVNQLKQNLTSNTAAYNNLSKYLALTENTDTYMARQVQVWEQAAQDSSGLPRDQQKRYFDAGLLLSDEDATYDGAVAFQSAATYVNLITNPEPQTIIKTPASPRDIAHNSKVTLTNAALSLPQSVATDAVAYRQPSMQAGSWGKSLYEATGQEAPEQISYESALKLMSTHRVLSKAWTGLNPVKDWEASLKDSTQIQAEALLMDWEAWKQEKATALMLSLLAAEKINGAK